MRVSSLLGRNASCCDFKQLFPGLAGVAPHCGTGECNFLRQVEVIPAYYAVPDQSIAAFCNLLIGLVSVFQTIWISDRNGAGEPVRQFDFAQLLLNGLAQFDLVDVVQDEHRLDDLAESLHPKFSSWGKTELCQVFDVEPITLSGNFNNC